MTIAAATRLWGIDWGLPFLYHPDEPNDMARTLTMLQTGDPNPHWFHYGSLMFYVYGAGLLLAGAGRSVLGWGEGVTTAELPVQIANATGILADPWTLLVGRVISMLLSVATVALIFLIVRRLTNRAWPSALAALLFAIGPVAVSEGRLYTPNTLTALLSAAAIWAAIDIYEKGRVRDYVLAGALVGLAAGTKYNAALVGVTVLVAHHLRGRTGSTTWSRGPLVAIYSSFVLFAISTPFALFDASTFLSDVGFELVHYSSGHVGREGGVVVYLAVLAVSFSIGLAFVPFALMDRALRPATIIAGSFAVGYVAFLSLFQATFERNLLPALPAFCIVVGLGVHAYGNRGEGATSRVGVILLSVVMLAVAGVGLAADRLQLEDREPARQWIRENLPEDAVIIVEGYSPWVDPGTYRVVTVEYVAEAEMTDGWDYILISEEGSGRFEADSDLYPTQVAALESLRDSSCLVKDFSGVVEIRRQDCA